VLFCEISMGIKDRIKKIGTDIRSQYTSFGRVGKILTWTVVGGLGLASAAVSQRLSDGETVFDGKLSETKPRVTYVEDIGLFDGGARMEFSRDLYNFVIEDDNSVDLDEEGKERILADSIDRVSVSKNGVEKTYTEGPVYDKAQKTYSEFRGKIKDKVSPDKGYSAPDGSFDQGAIGALDSAVSEEKPKESELLDKTSAFFITAGRAFLGL
jgi:hypothetical protein